MIIRLLIGLSIIFSSITVHACDFDQQLENIERTIKESRHVLNRKSLEDRGVVKRHLKVMSKVDQEVRKLFIDFDNPTSRKLLEDVDYFHTDHLKAILTIYGWITISKFGNDADHQAWLLVQHADHDPEFQEKCLGILRQLLPLHETDKKNYAYLYDRVALNSSTMGFKQRYGTQANIVDGQIEIAPFEGSIDDLNRRRHEMGFEPIEDYMKTLKRIYKK